LTLSEIAEKQVLLRKIRVLYVTARISFFQATAWNRKRSGKNENKKDVFGNCLKRGLNTCCVMRGQDLGHMSS